jgi:hypothetical protein
MRIITKLLLLLVITVGSLNTISCGKAKSAEPEKRVFPIKLLPATQHNVCIKYAADVDILNMKDVFIIPTDEVRDWPIICFAMQKDIFLNSLAVNKNRQDVFIVDRYLNGDFPDYVPVQMVDYIKENANIFQIDLTDEMKEADQLEFIIHYSLYSEPATDMYSDNKGEFVFNTLDYWFPTNISSEETMSLDFILPEDYSLYMDQELQTPVKDEYFRVYNLTIQDPYKACQFKGVKS